MSAARTRIAMPVGSGRFVMLTAVGSVLFGVAATALDPWPAVQVWPILLAFGVAIAVGEYFRFRVESGRHLAPLSLASALALALVSDCGRTDLSAVLSAPVTLVTATAMVVGVLPHVLTGRVVQGGEFAARYLGAGMTSWVYRVIPFDDGRTLASWAAHWQGPRWPIALVMAAVSILGLLTYVLATALVTAAREHRGLGPAMRDHVRAGAGLTLALSATGTLVALAAVPLGVVALPLFLLPIVLTQFALRQHAAILRTFGQTVRVLSRITETGGFTRSGHADRVAELAVEMGRDLGLTDRATRNLEYAALLHDIGQVALRDPIPAGATVMAAPADQQRIADDGAAIVRKTGAPAEVAEAVAWQATPYRVVFEQGLALPVASRIIKVANAYDDLTGGSITPRRREAALERIVLGLGYEYDPRAVDALRRVLARRELLR